MSATCRWPELKGKLDEWYFDIMDSLDVHTEAEVTPDYSDGRLIFTVSTTYDIFRDGSSEVRDAWQEDEFRQLVYNSLPKKLRDQAEPEDLSVSLEVNYNDRGKSQISSFSISLIEGESTADFTAGIGKESLESIKDYVIRFCTEQDSSAEHPTQRGPRMGRNVLASRFKRIVFGDGPRRSRKNRFYGLSSLFLACCFMRSVALRR